MDITKRRLIFILFLIAFILCTPVIILYVSGYRYNFKKNNWEKTGIIFIQTEPEKINLFLNDNLKPGSSPYRLKNLLPNEYHLKITKDGYYSWEKNINVNSGQTTFLQYIKLFKKNPTPEIIINGYFDYTTINPAKTKIALIENINNKQNLVIFDLLLNKIKKSPAAISQIQSINFVDNNIIQLTSADNLIFIDSIQAETNTPLSFKTATNIDNASNLKIFNHNYHTVYYTVNGKLFSSNLLTKIKNDLGLSPSPIIDYYLDDNFIYIIDNQSLGSSLVKKINLSDLASSQTISTLPRSDKYEFKLITKNYIVIKNKLTKDTIILNQETNQQKTIKNVNFITWNQNQNQLLYTTDRELWTIDLTNQNQQQSYTSTLLVRASNNIESASLYPNDTHILYSISGNLSISENIPGQRVIQQLISLESISNITTNKKGDNIYFIAKIGNQQGLYQLQIQ